MQQLTITDLQIAENDRNLGEAQSPLLPQSAESKSQVPEEKLRQLYQKRIPLEKLKANPKFLTRYFPGNKCVQNRVVKHYSQNASIKDSAISVIHLENGDYWILDGMHRLQAAKLRGDKDILCEVVAAASDSEAFLVAVRANTEHGLPYTRRDLSLICQRLGDHGFSQEEIGKVISRNKSNVSRMLSDLKKAEEKKSQPKVLTATKKIRSTAAYFRNLQKSLQSGELSQEDLPGINRELLPNAIAALDKLLVKPDAISL